MASIDKETGIQPAVRKKLSNMAKAMSGDITIEILTANVTPVPTAEAWSYPVQFQLIDSAGVIHGWANQDLGAAASDDSTAGAASVSDATPAVVDGIGTVNLIGDEAAWLDTEVATLTMSGTVLGVTLTEKTFTVTFTAV
jgi:hypothetical protein